VTQIPPSDRRSCDRNCNVLGETTKQKFSMLACLGQAKIKGETKCGDVCLGGHYITTSGRPDRHAVEMQHDTSWPDWPRKRFLNKLRAVGQRKETFHELPRPNGRRWSIRLSVCPHNLHQSINQSYLYNVA